MTGKTRKYKEKGKKQPTPSKRGIVFFSILVMTAAIGSMMVYGLFRQPVRSTLLDRLPEIPAFHGRNIALQDKLVEAQEGIVKSVRARIGGNELGLKIGNLGMLYQANHFFNEAASCYGIAMQLEKENPRWFYLLASIHQERGENAPAVPLLEETIAKNPSYSPGLLKLADTYFKLGDAERAKLNYNRRLELKSNDPYALLGLSRIALRESEWETAETFLHQAIDSDPGFGDAHRLLAKVHNHYGRIEESKQAIDRANQCLRFHPAPDPWIDDLMDFCYDPDLLLVLGSRALSRLDMNTALTRLYPRALKLDPQNPQVHIAIGKGLFMTGQTKKAKGFYHEAIRLDPECDEAYFQVGVIFQNEGRQGDAEEMFSKALEFQPQNANVHNNLGVARLHLGQYEEAVDSFEKALDIYPEHIEAIYNLGMAFWARGMSAEAADRYRRVLQLKPGWPVAGNSLAWILATDKNKGLRNGSEALHLALLACEKAGFRNPEYLDTLAAAYAELGEFDRAVQASRKAINLAQGNGETDLVKEFKQHLGFFEKRMPLGIE